MDPRRNRIQDIIRNQMLKRGYEFSIFSEAYEIPIGNDTWYLKITADDEITVSTTDLGMICCIKEQMIDGFKVRAANPVKVFEKKTIHNKESYDIMLRFSMALMKYVYEKYPS